MSRSLGRSTVLALAALCCWTAPAPAAEIVPGEVVVGFTEGSSAATRAAARAAVRGDLQRRLGDPDVQLLEVDGGVRAAVAELRGRRGVRFAEPNYVGHVAATVPNDPRFAEQWNLTRIGLRDAWDVQRGSPDVRVAVIDTGVDLDHPDLDDRILTVPGSDVVAGDGDPQDEHGHGTHVAGIAAAEGDNGLDGTGVAWDVTLVPVRACDAAGRCETADQAEALHVARAAGARVVNMSIQGPGSEAVAQAIGEDVLVVAAAGNSNQDVDVQPSFPCAYATPSVVCVAATLQSVERKMDSSNFGDATVDLAAPGSNIRSTVLGGKTGLNQGTSMAAPHVAGVAALLWSAAPGASVAAVKDTITGSTEAWPALQGVVAGGGFLDAATAVLPPDAAIVTGPPALTNDTTPAFTFASAKAPVTFECRVDGGAWGSCAPTVTGDGPHILEARAVDAFGTAGPAASRDWTLDTDPPAAAITAVEVDGRRATVSFTADEPGTFECAIDGGPASPCASPVAFERLANGGHEVSVRATDAAGNAGAADAEPLTVDAPPLVEITSHPMAQSGSSSASFTFRAVDPEVAATFECSLDGAAFALCPGRYDGLAEGAHVLRVRVPDGDETVFGWTVDLTAPVVGIESAPHGTVASRSAAVAFTADGPAECRVDEGGFAPCTSPLALGGLSDGRHDVVVRARDGAGNEGTAAASWTVDATGPAVRFAVFPAAASPDGTATFAFTTEDGAGTECSLDGAPFTPCASPVTLTGVADGVHAFAVRGRDALGNAGSPVAREFTVARPAPPAPPAPGPAAAGPAPELEPPAAIAAQVARRFRRRTPKAAARLRPFRLDYAGTVAGRLAVRVVLRGRKPLTVASGSLRLARPDAGRLTVRVSRRGARILRRRRAGTLQITATFTPASGDAVSATRRVRLRRR